MARDVERSPAVGDRKVWEGGAVTIVELRNEPCPLRVRTDGAGPDDFCAWDMPTWRGTSPGMAWIAGDVQDTPEDSWPLLGSVRSRTTAKGEIHFVRVDSLVDSLGSLCARIDTCMVGEDGLRSRVRQANILVRRLGDYRNTSRPWPERYTPPAERSTLVDVAPAPPPRPKSLLDILAPLEKPRDLRGVFVCLQCLGPCFDAYMLDNGAWNRARMDVYARALLKYGERAELLRTADGHIHLGCVEMILGRSLTLADFSDAPINDAIRWAWRKGTMSGSS